MFPSTQKNFKNKEDNNIKNEEDDHNERKIELSIQNILNIFSELNKGNTPNKLKLFFRWG